LTFKEQLAGITTILFDFDGVLMQSIEDHHRSWNLAFHAYRVEIGWEEFSILEGQSLYTIARQLCGNHHIAETEAENIANTKNEIYLRTSKIRLYDGALPLLSFLKEKNYCLGLVTGAHRDRFDQTVEESFKSYFQIIVTADDVRKTKPDPEPFLTAAERLKKNRSECVVVENAPLGVEAAKNAGMLCAALTTTLPERFLHRADWTGNGLGDIKELFE
jgi:beta-phosphoglucomutase